MKKIISLVFLVFLSVVLTSCDTIQNSDTKPADNGLKEKPIEYEIEKIVLSKGYQSLEPNIEILEKNEDVKILVSLGLVESSGIKIDRITENNEEVNIYTNRLLEDDKTQLAIPQAIINLKISDKDNLDDIKFNIINQNYDPIELKFGKSQILNKIYSQFKISPNTTPIVDLVRTKESFIWNIDFSNISETDDWKSPLINLNVKADANTGEVVLSDKEVISEYIDNGLILDYIPGKYLLYKQEEIDGEESTNILWLYNLQNKKKEKLYETNDLIYSATFSPDNKNIAFIENDESISNIFLINIDEKTTNKITPVDYNHTWNMKWKDENNLYFINNDSENKSTLLKYSTTEKKSEEVFSVGKVISDFDFKNDLIVFTEYDEKKLNQNIYITRDGSSLVTIDEGYKISFLNDSTIIYLKNLQNENTNILSLYSLEDNSKITETGVDVKDYIKLDPNNLLIIAKNSSNKDYTIMKYNTENKFSKPIGEITGEVLFYDEALNKCYISLSPPIENEKRHIIYSIDLNKLNINKK